MTLATNLAILIKAAAGETVITDSIAAIPLSDGTGTATLVNDGTYGYLWRITGGHKSASFSTLGNLNAATNTLMMRFRITTRAANYTKFAAIGYDAGHSMTIANNGSSTGGLIAQAAAINPAVYPSYTAGNVVTMVYRFQEGATDYADLWIGTTGRGVTTPDLSANATLSWAARAIILLDLGVTAETLDVLDFGFWTRGLTNDEAAAVADDPRGQLYGGGTQALTPSLFTNSNTFYAPTVSLAASPQDLTPALFSNTNVFYAATVALAGSTQALTPSLFTNTNTFYAPTVARVPGFFTPVLKNNTGTVLASETGVTCNVYNTGTGALVLHKTGLVSDGSGIVSVTDAALTAGTTYVYEIILTSARRLPTAAA